MNKLCIAIRSLKRADYLKRCLDSLEKNVDLNADFWLFQDGEINPWSKRAYATLEEVRASRQVFEDADLPNKHIHQDEFNKGCLPQYFEQLEILTPLYDYIASIPNDIQPNKYYIKTLNTLFEQFKNDKKLGMLQTSFWCSNDNLQSKEEAFALEDKVSYGFGYQTEQCFWSDKWPLIRPHMKKYMDIIQGHDYYDVLHNSPISRVARNKLINLYDKHPADHALQRSVEMAGLTGLYTRALRFKIIGEKGFYSFHSTLFDEQFKDVQLYEVGNVDKYILI